MARIDFDFTWLHRDSVQLALLLREVHEERLQEAAADVADPVLGDAVDVELDFLEVAEACARILRDAFEYAQDLSGFGCTDPLALTFAG